MRTASWVFAALLAGSGSCRAEPGAMPTAAPADAVVAAPPAPVPEEPDDLTVMAPTERPAPPELDIEPEPAPDPADPLQFKVLVHTKAVMAGPLADKAREVGASFPDFPFWRGGIDPFVDFDDFMVVTADPQVFTWATIIARHDVTEKRLIGAIEEEFDFRKESMTWREENGTKIGTPSPDGKADWDPREIVVIDAKHFAYVHPALVGSLDEHVRALDQFAKTKASSQLVVDLGGYALPANAFPVPLFATFTAQRVGDVEVELALDFSTADKAKEFETAWKVQLRQAIERQPSLKMSAGTLYDQTTLSRRAKRIELRTTLTDPQTRMLLGLMGSRIDRSTTRSPLRPPSDPAERAPEPPISLP